MAWINIASTRFETKAKLIKSLKNWEHEDELIGTHNLGLSALIYGNEHFYEQTKKFTDKWLTYYLNKDDKTLSQTNIFPVFANLCILDLLNGNQSGNHLGRVIKLKLPKQKPLRSLQKIIVKAFENNFSDVSARKTIQGHIDTEEEWLTVLDTGDIHQLFDLSMCPDHPLWSGTLADFCLPLALLLYKVEQQKQSTVTIEEYMQSGAWPRRHKQVLYERQAPKPPIDITVTDDIKTWPGFDAIERKDDKLFVYHWLGFSWKASLDFDPKETINAFRPLLFTDLGWKLVKNHIESSQWAGIEEDINSQKVVHVLVYNPSWSEEDQKETRKAVDYLKMDIQVLDFTAI